MDNWKCDIKNWTDIKLETANFFFLQAEKILESTNAVNQQLMSKSHKIIVLLVSLITASIGYFLSLIKSGNFFTAESASIIFFTISLTISLCYALKVWKPKTEFFRGSEPRKLMDPAFIKYNDQGVDDQNQLVRVLFSECHDYQKRIDINIEHNLNYSSKLTKSIKYFIYSPFVALIVYLIVIFLGFVRPYHS